MTTAPCCENEQLQRGELAWQVTLLVNPWQSSLAVMPHPFNLLMESLNGRREGLIAQMHLQTWVSGELSTQLLCSPEEESVRQSPEASRGWPQLLGLSCHQEAEQGAHLEHLG